MLRSTLNRSLAVRIAAVLCIATVFWMGTAQAAHSHPDDSPSSRHTCSICSVSSIGPVSAAVSGLPVVHAVALAQITPEGIVIFRPASGNFIRPPPAV